MNRNQCGRGWWGQPRRHSSAARAGWQQRKGRTIPRYKSKKGEVTVLPGDRRLMVKNIREPPQAIIKARELAEKQKAEQEKIVKKSRGIGTKSEIDRLSAFQEEPKNTTKKSEPVQKTLSYSNKPTQPMKKFFNDLQKSGFISKDIDADSLTRSSMHYHINQGVRNRKQSYVKPKKVEKKKEVQLYGYPGTMVEAGRKSENQYILLRNQRTGAVGAFPEDDAIAKIISGKWRHIVID